MTNSQGSVVWHKTRTAKRWFLALWAVLTVVASFTGQPVASAIAFVMFARDLFDY